MKSEFDKAAETFGVEFSEKGERIRVPFVMDQQVYKLIISHYNEISNINTNCDYFIDTILKLVSEKHSYEFIKNFVDSARGELKEHHKKSFSNSENGLALLG